MFSLLSSEAIVEKSGCVYLVEGNRLSLSFMTIAELYQWAAVRNWGIEKIARLVQAFTNYLIISIVTA